MPVRIKMPCPSGALFDAAKGVVRSLRGAGYPAYWVGGSVRDLCLGASPKDIDLVTTATPETIRKVYPDADLVGACFGVSLVKADGFVFEAATCREERGYSDGRRPDQVRYTTSFETDLMRRDFTVNALLYDPERGEVVDHVAGLADLADRTVRAVGDPEVRFQEDYLRMLRAVRFAAKLGFRLAPTTFAAISKYASRVKLLAQERVRAELELMLTGPAPSTALRLLKETGLLAAVLPEVDALSGVTQPKLYHPEGDVWQHTLRMFDLMKEPPSAALAWSVLLHDIGKPATRAEDENKVPHFYGHEAEGARMAEELAERLHFSNLLRDQVVHAVRNHMRMASVREMREAKLRRLLAEPDFAMELELHRLDCASSHGKMECYEFLKEKSAALPPVRELPEPLVKGGDLIAAGCAPGPEFKTILEAMFDAQLEGAFTARDGALDYLKQHLPALRG